LSLGKMLDALPPHLVLYGVEISAASPQDGLSDAVAQAIPPLLQAIARELAGVYSIRS
jgi:Ni,Fe-hydrogenase maturation factor